MRGRLFTLHDRLAADLLLNDELLEPSLYDEAPALTAKRVEAERLEGRLKFALEKLQLARADREDVPRLSKRGGRAATS